MIDEATKPRNRSPISARYYKFESISLQRGVCCEPDPVDQGAELQLASHRRISESGFMAGAPARAKTPVNDLDDDIPF